MADSCSAFEGAGARSTEVRDELEMKSGHCLPKIAPIRNDSSCIKTMTPMTTDSFRLESRSRIVPDMTVYERRCLLSSLSLLFTTSDCESRDRSRDDPFFSSHIEILSPGDLSHVDVRRQTELILTLV